MKRTTVILPLELENRAKVTARKRGVSFAEFVRRAIEAELNRSDACDPLADMDFVWEGPAPRDGAANHDTYLYGDGEGEQQRSSP